MPRLGHARCAPGPGTLVRRAEDGVGRRTACACHLDLGHRPQWRLAFLKRLPWGLEAATVALPLSGLA